MPPRSAQTALPLPRGWRKITRAGVLHAISVAAMAMGFVRFFTGLSFRWLKLLQLQSYQRVEPPSKTHSVTDILTRDGGVDIYAFVRHAVASFLMVVECKRWAPDKAVGIEVVQRLYGVQQSKSASKSLIVTTSYFSSPALEQCREYRGLMELRDFEDLKTWLDRYNPGPDV